MPAYKAVGVSAYLHVTRPKDRLSGAQTGFENHPHLPERPLGINGSSRARSTRASISRAEDSRPASSTEVVQFIGPHEDLPYCMVEAGESLVSDIPRASSARRKTDSRLSGVDDSSLTSFSATTAFGAPRQSLTDLPSDVERHDSFLIPLRGFSKAPNVVAQTPEPQDITLVIQTDAKAFEVGELEAMNKDERSNTTLQIEVFMNGQLADTIFLNASSGRATRSTKDELQACFASTRVNPRAEMPWVYRDFQTLVAGQYTAEQRWTKAAAALKEEALTRGVNKWGISPPNAEYLTALSATPFPKSLKKNASLGILDVVVTIGGRKKRNPDAALVDLPMQMSSSVVGTRSSDDQLTKDGDKQANPQAETAGNLKYTPVSEPPQKPPEYLYGTRSQTAKARTPPIAHNTGMASQQLVPPVPASPDPTVEMISEWSPPKKNKEGTLALAKAHGLEKYLQVKVENLRTRRGQGPIAKSVYHRLVNIQKMGTLNRSRALQSLKDKVLGPTQAPTTTPTQVQMLPPQASIPDLPTSPVRKRRKTETEIQMPPPQASMPDPPTSPVRKRRKTQTEIQMPPPQANTTDLPTSPVRKRRKTHDFVQPEDEIIVALPRDPTAKHKTNVFVEPEDEIIVALPRDRTARRKTDVFTQPADEMAVALPRARTARRKTDVFTQPTDEKIVALPRDRTARRKTDVFTQPADEITVALPRDRTARRKTDVFTQPADEITVGLPLDPMARLLKTNVFTPPADEITVELPLHPIARLLKTNVFTQPGDELTVGFPFDNIAKRKTAVFPQPADEITVEFPLDPIASLAQARMDFAMELGAPPDGYLAQRIAALSPHRPPIQNIPAHAPKLMSSPMRPSRAEAKSRPSKKRSRAVDETSMFRPENEIIGNSKIGTSSEGSVLGYGPQRMSRGPVSARPADFSEEQVVVGMRFVVV